MSANILIQNELDENLTYSSRVGEFSSNSLWIKRLALISLLVLQLPLHLIFCIKMRQSYTGIIFTFFRYHSK